MILWGKDHDARAQALAHACGEQAQAPATLGRGPRGMTPVTCSGAILTVWGHGAADSCAEMSQLDFGLLIHNWKKLKGTLKQVEIITCDARHNGGAFAHLRDSLVAAS